MGAVTFSGLASGLDTTGIVNSLVGVAKIPITKLQTEQTTIQSQSKQIADIKTDLTTLEAAATALSTKDSALVNKVSSSTESVLTATAAGGSSSGAFKVDVTSLAQPERTYSNTFASSSDAGLAGAGQLSIQVGTGDAVNIDIAATDSLADIASKINKSGAGVSAGIFSDGSSYRLQVTGTQSGAANQITFGETGVSLGLTDPANEKQAATDALLTIDGMQVHSATNTVTGAVPGVTLNLASIGSSTIKVDRDADGLSAKLATFVKSYNDVMKTLNTEFSTTSGLTKASDSLSGDSTMRTLQSALRSLASKTMANGTSALQTFGSIGLVSQRDGSLVLDSTKFNKAVASDYDGVASLLAGRTDGTGLMSSFASGVDQYTKSAGTLDAKIKNYADRSKDFDTQIAAMQRRLTSYTDTLNAQYAALETTMSGLKSQGNALSSILASSSSSSSG
ncbi:MAG: Flagellar hook-associated protein FliD [Myxococcaceae bacterium]|nr:Flagellar hook-associated protein FliD [Myxococcaceae bacterium]